MGSWSVLGAEDAQKALDKRVLSTQRLVVIRCEYEKDADFPVHSHLQEQITIVEEGQLEFVIEGKSLLVSKGEMISICPRVPHETRVAGPGRAVALNLFLHELEARTSAPSSKAPAPSRF